MLEIGFQILKLANQVLEGVVGVLEEQLGPLGILLGNLVHQATKLPQEVIRRELQGFGAGLGVVGGHSGTVIGVLYDEGFDAAGFTNAFKTDVSPEAYEAIMLCDVVTGGVRLQIDN